MDSQKSPTKTVEEIIKEGAALSDDKLLESFKSFSDQTKLSLFHRMINGKPTPYDELLNAWWMNRY